METSYIGPIVSGISVIISAIFAYRTSVFKGRLDKAEKATERELSSVEQAFKGWKDINDANTKKIGELDEDCSGLRTELDIEKEKRHNCELNLAKLNGKVEVLTNVSVRQTEIQSAQDLRQSERMDRQDTRQNLRHERQDSRQDVQDERLDERDKRMDERDARTEAQSNVLHAGDTVQLVPGEGDK